MLDGVSEQPLSVLLSRVLGMLTNQLEGAAGVATGAAPRLAVGSNVLRCVDDAGPEGLSERDLPAAARISSRLATAALTAAAHRGWVATDASEGAKRWRMTLTDRGRKAAEIWRDQLATLDEEWTDTPPERIKKVDAEWRERFGDASIASLRDTLDQAAAAAPADLPDHVVAPLDGSR